MGIVSRRSRSSKFRRNGFIVIFRINIDLMLCSLYIIIG